MHLYKTWGAQTFLSNAPKILNNKKQPKPIKTNDKSVLMDMKGIRAPEKAQTISFFCKINMLKTKLKGKKCRIKILKKN